jgi:hypothetical protein
MEALPPTLTTASEQSPLHDGTTRLVLSLLRHFIQYQIFRLTLTGGYLETTDCTWRIFARMWITRNYKVLTYTVFSSYLYSICSFLDLEHWAPGFAGEDQVSTLGPL